MAVRVKDFNRNSLQWAVERADLELDDLLLAFPKLMSWINGEVDPTIKQLENFTKRLHVPFGYLFLQEFPKEKLEFPFFRSDKDKLDKVSLNVLHSIQILTKRQEWLTDYMIENGYDKLEFVSMHDVTSTPQEIVKDIRETLNLSPIWATMHSNWEKALDYITYKIEEAGIIVTFNGVVENNTKRIIPTDECRGFVLVNEYAPFLFINSADAKAAQMFTMIHELAHIWLGFSAGFDNDKMLPADDPIEKLCDSVAAEFLVPAIELSRIYSTVKHIPDLSKMFKVSQIVIARRLLDLKFIEKNTFFDFYHQYMDGVITKKANAGSGGNFYATARKRVSLRFASFVHNAVKENKLLYRDAYRLTSLKGDTYSRFVKEQLLQS